MSDLTISLGKNLGAFISFLSGLRDSSHVWTFWPTTTFQNTGIANQANRRAHKIGNNLLVTQMTKSSKREDKFFEDVFFYTMNELKQLPKNECGYTKLESEVFQEVLDCFNAKADYMLSSNSIYKMSWNSCQRMNVATLNWKVKCSRRC